MPLRTVMLVCNFDLIFWAVIPDPQGMKPTDVLEAFACLSSLWLFLVVIELCSQLLDGLPFGTDIHGPQKMNPNAFGNPLDFPQAATGSTTIG